MKNNLIKILAILLLIILQFSFFSKLSIFGFAPNLIFVISIILLLRGFLADSFLLAILGGFFLDLTSPLRFGIYSFSLIAILLLLNFVVLKNIPAINPVLTFLLTFGAFIIIDLFICLVILALPSWQIIIDGLISGVFGLVTFFVLGKFVRQEEIKFT